MQNLEVDDTDEKAICASCVGEKYLKAEIENQGTRRVCHYCGETENSFTLDEIAERIEQAFYNHFSRTAQGPDAFESAMLSDRESNYSWDREGQQTVYAIMDAAEISEQAAGDIQSILSDNYGDYDAAISGEETAFDSDAYYEEIMPGDEEWQASWRAFEKTIKSEARFFSRTGAAQLAALFDDIETMRTRDGQALIVAAGPGTDLTHLYRARAFQSDSKLIDALKRPDLELSAPPSALAAAGRMNAKGISAFYGATDIDIALAEVRPPVGSQVGVARFEIIRPLRLLDLNKLKGVHETGSIFDPGYASRLGRMMFLRSLSEKMARPVMPDDQDFEYLPTQAVADYLATEGKVPLDGILFPSVQADSKGVNAVLFYKASRCETLEIPEDTEIDARTSQLYEEGLEPEYTVIEWVPEPKPKEPKHDPHPFDFEMFDPENSASADNRQMTLRIDLESIKVHVIESVKFTTTQHTAKRHRWIKTEPSF